MGVEGFFCLSLMCAQLNRFVRENFTLKVGAKAQRPVCDILDIAHHRC